MGGRRLRFLRRKWAKNSIIAEENALGLLGIELQSALNTSGMRSGQWYRSYGNELWEFDDTSDAARLAALMMLQF